MFMTIQEVAAYYGKHIETIRRWTNEARAKKSTFPLPITPLRKKRMWRRVDIENWDANCDNREESVVERAVRRADVRSRLARHGIILK
jgi:hypothetical protein